MGVGSGCCERDVVKRPESATRSAGRGLGQPAAGGLGIFARAYWLYSAVLIASLDAYGIGYLVSRCVLVAQRFLRVRVRIAEVSWHSGFRGLYRRWDHGGCLQGEVPDKCP